MGPTPSCAPNLVPRAWKEPYRLDDIAPGARSGPRVGDWTPLSSPVAALTFLETVQSLVETELDSTTIFFNAAAWVLPTLEATLKQTSALWQADSPKAT